MGSNIGNRYEYLKKSIIQINQKDVYVKQCSGIYETSPVGYVPQSTFYNMVLKIETSLSPKELLNFCMNIEQQLDRTREIHWGPRTIDIDILIYEQEIIKSKNLNIPHPELINRAFVLIPLREVAGNINIPGSLKSVDECIRVIPKEQEVNELSLCIS